MIIYLSQGVVNPIGICHHLSLYATALTHGLDKKKPLIQLNDSQQRRQVNAQLASLSYELINQIPQAIHDNFSDMARNLSDNQASRLKHLMNKMIDSGTD